MWRFLGALVMLATGCESPSKHVTPTTSTASAATSAVPVSSAAPATPVATIADDHIVVRVMRINGGLRAAPAGASPPPFREPIVVIRGDGAALWSEDKLGGGPLKTGDVDPARLARWIDDVRKSGVLQDTEAMRSHVGPDARAIELSIDLVDQKLTIVSWHEMVDPTKSIALSTGIVGLDGRDPSALIAKEPAEYQRFLKQWAALRSDVQALLPKNGEPFADGTSIESWLELRKPD